MPNRMEKRRVAMLGMPRLIREWRRVRFPVQMSARLLVLLTSLIIDWERQVEQVSTIDERTSTFLLLIEYIVMCTNICIKMYNWCSITPEYLRQIGCQP